MATNEAVSFLAPNNPYLANSLDRTDFGFANHYLVFFQGWYLRVGPVAPPPAPALRATAVVAKTTVAETAEAARTEAVAWLWAMHHGGLPLPLSDGTSV